MYGFMQCRQMVGQLWNTGSYFAKYGNQDSTFDCKFFRLWKELELFWRGKLPRIVTHKSQVTSHKLAVTNCLIPILILSYLPNFQCAFCRFIQRKETGWPATASTNLCLFNTMPRCMGRKRRPRRTRKWTPCTEWSNLCSRMGGWWRIWWIGCGASF